jgi:hypothetical protein
MNATAHQNEQAIRRRQWLAHIKAQKNSGLNRTEYCKQYNLSYNAMTYWYGKALAPLVAKTTLVPVPFQRDTVRRYPRHEQVGLCITLSKTISIEVGDNFSSSTLTRLLDTLETR